MPDLSFTLPLEARWKPRTRTLQIIDAVQTVLLTVDYDGEPESPPDVFEAIVRIVNESGELATAVDTILDGLRLPLGPPLPGDPIALPGPLVIFSGDERNLQAAMTPFHKDTP